MPADDRCAAGGVNAAGWVLGALDPADAERFARHLPMCRGCRLAVAELGPTARVLLAALPGPRGPAGANNHEWPVK
jgi:hypothetical protein